MNAHQTCPCCDNSLLRHIRHGKIYWFCSHCWQEVPLLTLEEGQGMKRAEGAEDAEGAEGEKAISLSKI